MEESVVSAAAAVLAPAPIVGHFVVVTMKRKCSDWHGKFNPGSRQRIVQQRIISVSSFSAYVIISEYGRINRSLTSPIQRGSGCFLFLELFDKESCSSQYGDHAYYRG